MNADMCESEIDDLCIEIARASSGKFHHEDICIDLTLDGYVSYVMIDAKVIISSSFFKEKLNSLKDLQGIIVMYQDGMHPHRLRNNPEEKRILDHWNKKYSNDLERLCSCADPPETLTERDKKIAATMIQWLGSPVGQNFLEELGFVK